jgi:hypothetical protein
MHKQTLLLSTFLALTMSADVFAQRERPSGPRGGGGGGGGGGGMSRPSPAPRESRSEPRFERPSPRVERPSFPSPREERPTPPRERPSRPRVEVPSERPSFPRPDRPVERPTPPRVERPSERPSFPRPDRPVERPTPPRVERPDFPRPDRPVERPTPPRVERPDFPRPDRPVERPTPPRVERPTDRPTPPRIERPNRPSERPNRPRVSPNPRAPRNPGRVISRPDYRPHRPRVSSNRNINYHYPRDYYSRVNRRYIYYRWVQEPVYTSYSNGYYDIDGYPYYVDSGYRYRYSPVETCKYELVDGATNVTVEHYPENVCNYAYDTCAQRRDQLNSNTGLDQYFCAEAVDPDLQQSEDETFDPSLEQDEMRSATVRAFLEGKSYQDIFNTGLYQLGSCVILNLRGNENGCRYIVTVNGEYFPDSEGNICSAPQVAVQAGCHVGTEQENAGCLFKKAIMQGRCL